MSRFRRSDDEGMALITVMVIGAVLMVLVASGLTVALSGLNQAVTVQRGTSALDAAFAGAQDYLARVNVDESYVEYGNRASTFTATSAVTMPPTTNPAFGVGTTGTWAEVAGSNGNAKFRYEVDTTKYASTGVVRLRVTGLAGERTTTLLASLRVRGFVDYAYFTDYEMKDPQISGAPQSCVKHVWEGRANRCGGVDDIQFGPNDVIYGDVHSNDTLRICGSTFVGATTTANTRSPLYIKPAGCANPTATITRAPSLPLPSTNSAMKQDAACVYTGPTQITYHADGTMTVVSPWTRFTKVTAGAGSNPTKCGTIAGLHSAQGTRVSQLASDLLYVQSVPPLSTDPNYWAPSDTPSDLSCIGADGATTTAGTGIGWRLSTSGDTIRYPLVGESPAEGWANTANLTQWNTTTPAYGCRSGDLYVKGTVTTLTTAASANYVYIVDDVKLLDRTSDVIGLVGENAVLIWNPMSASDDQPMLTDFNRKLEAAVVSVVHTFQIQNYARGATRGAVILYGSIAQKFRGPTGVNDCDDAGRCTPSSGYTKSYQYDPLLKTVSPPKFLEPSATKFAITRYASVPQAFSPDGTQR